MVGWQQMISTIQINLCCFIPGIIKNLAELLSLKFCHPPTILDCHLGFHTNFTLFNLHCSPSPNFTACGNFLAATFDFTTFSLRSHQFLQLGYFCMDLILLYVYIASLELSIIIHIFTFFIQYWWQKSRLTVVSHAASTAEYSCRNNNDVITTSEYFTGMNVAQI